MHFLSASHNIFSFKYKILKVSAFFVERENITLQIFSRIKYHYNRFSIGDLLSLIISTVRIKQVASSFVSGQ